MSAIQTIKIEARFRKEILMTNALQHHQHILAQKITKKKKDKRGQTLLTKFGKTKLKILESLLEDLSRNLAKKDLHQHTNGYCVKVTGLKINVPPPHPIASPNRGV